MKKIAALFLLTFVLISVASCGDKDEQDPPKTEYSGELSDCSNDSSSLSQSEEISTIVTDESESFDLSQTPNEDVHISKEPIYAGDVILDVVGGDFGAWIEFDMTETEYTLWLEGKSTANVLDTIGKEVNIYEFAPIEEMRAFAKTITPYRLTLKGTKLQLQGDIKVSFYDNHSLLLQCEYKDTKNRVVGCFIRYHDLSFGNALNGDVVNYWNVREKTENRNLINLEDYKTAKRTVIDNLTDTAVDTTVIIPQNDPRRILFMYKGCLVEIFDSESQFAEEEFKDMGFSYLFE